MAKFKKGDRVRVVARFNSDDPLLAATGTVSEDGARCPYVEFDNWYEGHDAPFGDGRQTCWAVDEEDMELLTANSDSKESDAEIERLGSAARVFEQMQRGAERARALRYLTSRFGH